MTALLRGGFVRSCLIGAAATALFYQVLPILPDESGLIARYATGHPLEYAIIGLSIVAVVDLISRGVSAAVRRKQLQTLESSLPASDDWRVTAASVSDTTLRRRVAAFADLRERNAGNILEHADRFSARAADDLAGSYAPLTTILWAVPIVGFLGTVMGITIAVANISPEQLEDSLGNVTGGLAVAFDTTALALGLSLILGFATLAVRRTEERLLGRLDDLCDGVLIPAFPDEASGSTGSMTDATADLLTRHIAAWNDALAAQRSEFGRSLESGHRHFVSAWSDMQVDAIESQKLTWEATSDQLGDSLADWQAKLDQTLGRIAEGLPQVAVAATQQAAARMDATLAEIHERSTATHQELQSVAGLLRQRAAATEELVGRCETLASSVGTQMAEQNAAWADVLGKTQALSELQASLDSQFDRARVSEQLDQTIHQLTAAVHMLTARPRAAA